MSVVYKNGKVIYDPPLERTLTEKANRLVLQFTRYAQGVGLSADDIYIQRFLAVSYTHLGARLNSPRSSTTEIAPAPLPPSFTTISPASSTWI